MIGSSPSPVFGGCETLAEEPPTGKKRPPPAAECRRSRRLDGASCEDFLTHTHNLRGRTRGLSFSSLSRVEGAEEQTLSKKALESNRPVSAWRRERGVGSSRFVRTERLSVCGGGWNKRVSATTVPAPEVVLSHTNSKVSGRVWYFYQKFSFIFVIRQTIYLGG